MILIMILISIYLHDRLIHKVYSIYTHNNHRLTTFLSFIVGRVPVMIIRFLYSYGVHGIIIFILVFTCSKAYLVNVPGVQSESFLLTGVQWIFFAVVCIHKCWKQLLIKWNVQMNVACLAVRYM